KSLPALMEGPAAPRGAEMIWRVDASSVRSSSASSRSRARRLRERTGGEDRRSQEVQDMRRSFRSRSVERGTKEVAAPLPAPPLHRHPHADAVEHRLVKVRSPRG